MEIEIESIKKIDVQEGDVLVLTTERRISADQFQRLKETFREALPGIRLLMAENGITLKAYRPLE